MLIQHRRIFKAHRGDALSLVELLVLLGVIGALSVLLLPALQRAMENAKNVRCLANLKGCGQAIFAHAADNRQRLVVPYISKEDKDVAKFPHLKDHPQTGAWYTYLIEQKYIETADSVVCPSWAPYRYTDKPWGMAYGMRRTDSSSRYDDLIQATISTPARYILMADSHRPPLNGENRQWYYITWRGNELETIHFRHRRKAHILFLDGSVRAMSSQEVLDLDDGWTRKAFTEQLTAPEP